MTQNFTKKIEEVGQITYIGSASRGSSTSNPVWQIKKITEAGKDTSIEWADGSDDFDFVWDDRANYIYS